MIHVHCPITQVSKVGENIYELGFRSIEIASAAAPGQFVNIKVNDFTYPLLRRPFSVYNIIGEEIKIVFNVIGTGSRILSSKQPGEMIDVIGPLGCSYTVDDNVETGLLVGGGLGVAPLPMLTNYFNKVKRNQLTFLGARSRHQVVTQYLKNICTATDDGTLGYRGTVVDLLRDHLSSHTYTKPKIFACGPNIMLQAVGRLAEERGVDCEVSLESAMACGIGICQGCPVIRRNGEQGYALICKDGPVFNTQTIEVPAHG